ncbi:sigma-E factor negative regulatory protein [Polycyclovorans algicola]|uniref:sigma-E factor negative regulatory protein n=1 Tax=Polycyclovorans algicola TaxID=616992 RepID=UPI0004A72C62|nr:sigma-E factor negative regulatory protein [Polycyclovorans algicola]
MKNDEMLSAALDGECTSEELDQLLADLTNDPAAVQRWQTWAAVKASMGGARVGRVSADWSNAVMKSISMEAPPVMLAPATKPRPEPGVRVAQAPRRRRRSAWAAAGAAASVSAVALGWMLVSNPAAVSETPGFADVTTERPAPAQIAQLPDSRVSQMPVDTAARDRWLLNEYLMEHHQFAGSRGMGSTLRQAQFDVMASNVSFEESRP